MPSAVVVYGSSCPACTQAKAVLDRFGVGYTERAMSELPRTHGRVRSMPQITIGGELLGGVNQLLRLARAGGLERLARDEPGPWVQIRRRLGRGHDVVVLDALGREQSCRRAATRAEALSIAAALAGASGPPPAPDGGARRQAGGTRSPAG
jgi:glutaredoxin 3